MPDNHTLGYLDIRCTCGEAVPDMYCNVHDDQEGFTAYANREGYHPDLGLDPNVEEEEATGPIYKHYLATLLAMEMAGHVEQFAHHLDHKFAELGINPLDLSPEEFRTFSVASGHTYMKSGGFSA